MGNFSTAAVYYLPALLFQQYPEDSPSWTGVPTDGSNTAYRTTKQ
jgi:hypothetical protein